MGQSRHERTGAEDRGANPDLVSSHDVAHVSDAVLLELYQGLFAQSLEGKDPYSVGQSLPDLATETDERSLVGQELVTRYEERYAVLHSFLEHQLSSADMPGVSIRLVSNHDAEPVGQWRDPVAHVALAAFTAAITVEGHGTALIFLGGLDLRTDEVLTLHEFAERHGNEAGGMSEPGLEEPGFWASLAQGMIMPGPGIATGGSGLPRLGFDPSPIGALMMGKGEIKDFIVALGAEAIQGLGGAIHSGGADPITSYSLLFLARDAAQQRTSEQRVDGSPTYNDLAHSAVTHMVLGLTDYVPLAERLAVVPVDHGDRQAGQLEGEHGLPEHVGHPWDVGTEGLAPARPGPDQNEPMQGPHRDDDARALQMYPGIEAGPLRDDSAVSADRPPGASGQMADAHGGVGTPDAHLGGPGADGHGGVGTPDAHLGGPGADPHGGVGTPDAHLGGPGTDPHGGVGTPDAHLGGPGADAHGWAGADAYGGAGDQSQDTFDPGAPP
jgi:hypothetical protein